MGSKATGEPAMLMGCSVAFAIRNALRAGREELGITGDGNIPNWVNICKTPSLWHTVAIWTFTFHKKIKLCMR